MDDTFKEQFIEEEISLQEILFILRKRSKLIILITIISMLITGLITFCIIKPQYKSTTTLMVGKPEAGLALSPDSPMSIQEIQTNRLLVPTYAEIAKSRSVLNKVIEKLDLDITYEEMREKTDVSLLKDTELISISVTDEDPDEATRITNKLAESFSNKIKELMKLENIQVIDKAIPNDKPIKPRPVLNMAISFILGIMIGIFAAFLMEYLDTTIKSQEDIERYLDLPVIGNIPYIKEEEV